MRTTLAGQHPAQTPETWVTTICVVFFRHIRFFHRHSIHLILFGLSVGCAGSLEEDFFDPPEDIVEPPSSPDATPCSDINTTVLVSTQSEGCAVPGCHDVGGTSANLRLANEDLVIALIDQAPEASSSCANRLYISSSNPTDSLLYTLMTGTETCSQRMPPGNVSATEENISCVLTYLKSIVQKREPEPEPEDPRTTIKMEAEDNIVRGFQKVDDDTASNGQYVHDPNGGNNNTPNPSFGGLLQFSFTIKETGTYYIFAGYDDGGNADGSNDSFWVKVTEDTYFKWNRLYESTPNTQGSWHQGRIYEDLETAGKVEKEYNFIEGETYTIDILPREPYARLDWITITNNPNYID